MAAGAAPANPRRLRKAYPAYSHHTPAAAASIAGITGQYCTIRLRDSRRLLAACRRLPRVCRSRDRSARVGWCLAIVALPLRYAEVNAGSPPTEGPAVSPPEKPRYTAGRRPRNTQLDDQAKPATDPTRPDGGNAASLLRGFDWSASGLGPLAAWPPALRVAVDLLAASPSAMAVMWGRRGTLIYNDAYAAIAGARHPNLFGQPILKAWPEIAGHIAGVIKIVLTGKPLSFRDECLVLGRQGTPEDAWFDLDYSPVLGPDNRPAGVLAIVVETSARVRSLQQGAALAQSLRANEKQFRSLADALPHHVWLAAPDGQLNWFNARVYEYTGAPAGTFDGDAWAAVVHPEDLAHTDAAWAASLRSGEIYQNEFRLRRADGSFRWHLARAVPVRDAGGAILRWIGTNTDLHDNKQAAGELARLNATLANLVQERTAELLASQARLRTFFDHSSECHVLMRATPDGRFVYQDVNPAVLALYRLPREAVVGFSTDELFGAETAAEVNSHLTTCLAAIGPYRYVRTEGERIVEAVCARVSGGDGGAVQLVVTAHDITESRRLEDQLRQSQKMEAVGQLTGGIAHDFNNLLQGIVGSLDLLQKRLAQGRLDDIPRYAAGAMAAANRAASLTHRLLAFARRQPLDPKPVQANTLVASMEDLLRRTLGEHIALELVVAGGLWLTLCDPNQLESAVLNLAINARDAMPDGGRLTIETNNAHLDRAYAEQDRDVRPGQYVCLSVTDTGIGMSPDSARRAFDPFFTTKPAGQGTGLGLSMIYGFARQSDGAAKIYSEPGQGTTVKLYLPRHRGPAPAPDPTPDDILAHPSRTGETVLVVEDEAVVRDLVVELLRELGYQPLQAADGPAGLALLQSPRRIDLLITDIGLPGLNGRDLANAARLSRPNLPILFMTGYAENAALANGLLDPGMEMTTKPFAVDALATRIRNMLGNPNAPR